MITLPALPNGAVWMGRIDVSDLMPIPEDTKKRQRDASDPRVSAWVSANAGSGKTYVLSRRVIRLLLAGNDPATILCLTFTKAAANEMANRVFEELAKWTVLDDSALTKILIELGEPRPNALALTRARQLFAHALETPGGLKVQTIHAFCERLLQQFPFEANVPGHFEVADEETAQSLLSTARERVLADAIQHPQSDVGQAFDELVAIADDDTILGAISEVLRKRDQFMRSINTRENGLEQHQATLAQVLNVEPGTTLDDLTDQVMQGTLGGFGLQQLQALQSRAQESAGKKDQDVAARINAVLHAVNSVEQLSAWLAIFATAGKARKSGAFLSKALKEDIPELFAAIENVLPEGFDEVRSRVNAISTLSNTRALFVLTRDIIIHYLEVKNRRGLLDYDDLISKTGRLLSNADAALWVQYKLDRGLAHILVDEAQDTSPAQWRVVEALSDAFFHETAPDEQNRPRGPRTIFAVGDEKQSIYSFQGAAPDAFEDQRRAFERKARQAQLDWRSVKLNLSFRSVNDVLSAVDAVFSGPELASSVSKVGVDPHQAYRASAPGEVVLWPLVEEQRAEKPEDWRLPVDAPAGALEQIAGRIAADIAAMIRQGKTLANGRPVRPGDFLILLKKRGQVMGLVNRALKRAGVAVAGMDRLAL
ncbi:MAG: double-strand break repair helicase AddA, partial [Hyphomicrobiales bacterium]